jgi:hypothetical protein
MFIFILVDLKLKKNLHLRLTNLINIKEYYLNFINLEPRFGKFEIGKDLPWNTVYVKSLFHAD